MPILQDIVIIFALAVGVMLVLHRLKVPSMVGFLLTGVLCGPHGLRLVTDVHEVETLAETGIVLLLFAIGMEFSFEHLIRSRRAVFLGGTIQVVCTVLLSAFIAFQLGLPASNAIFIGFLISLSSTAITLKLLQDRAELTTPHGRTVTGIAIFQDIIAVPMMLVLPVLAGTGNASGSSGMLILVRAVVVVVVIFFGFDWLVPKVFYAIARTRSRELFLVSVVLVCFAIAWLTSILGLSLALGAFIAGLIISRSEYSHQALATILPFRDIFTSLFFVSVGMLLNVVYVVQHPLIVVLAVMIVAVLKAVIVIIAAYAAGLPTRNALLVGLTLFQVGEFSFILARPGLELNLLSVDNYQLFLAVSLLTMAATPFVVQFGGPVVQTIMRSSLFRGLKDPRIGVVNDADSLKDHIVIFGFGLNGRHLARSSRLAKIPYVIVELNTDTVRAERANGEPIIFGDATQFPVLTAVHVDKARVIAVLIDDPVAARRVVELCRLENPTAYLIVRTRYLKEVAVMRELGANEVIPEEFETSVEIFTRVLQKYLIPDEEIHRFVGDVRADSYEMLRAPTWGQSDLGDFSLHASDAEIRSYRVFEQSPLAGKTIGELQLRKKFGVTVLVIRRGETTIANPDATTRLEAGDLLMVYGLPDNIANLAGEFIC